MELLWPLITDIFFYALSPYHQLFKTPPTPSYLGSSFEVFCFKDWHLRLVLAP